MKNKKGKTIKILIIVLVICLIAGISIANGMKPISVRTYEAKKGNIETIISGSGTIAANKSRKQYSKISAEITDVFFEEGDHVNSRRPNNET